MAAHSQSTGVSKKAEDKFESSGGKAPKSTVDGELAKEKNDRGRAHPIRPPIRCACSLSGLTDRMAGLTMSNSSGT